ncbi:hypothetical protein ACFX19_028121 [Malus domestica]
MVVRTLDAKRDPFRPKEDEEDELYCTWLSALDPTSSSLLIFWLDTAIRLHANTRMVLKTFFATSRVKRIWACSIPANLRLLPPLMVLRLILAPYGSQIDSHLIGYTDAGYLSDPHWACSQTGYVFTVGDTAISWMFTKQTLVATFSNDVEILALHEALRECFWLRAVMEHIRNTSGLTSVVDLPTMIFKDNAACIEQLKKGYIKGDNTKHIAPKFFYSHQ